MKTIEPVDGDNSGHIKEAIQEVGNGRAPGDNPPERGDPSDTIQGAIKLEPGTYRIDSQVAVRSSGVVLRGSGSGSDPDTNTIIKAPKNFDHDTAFYLDGGTGWGRDGSKVDITTDFVRVGDRSFEVADTSPFEVGHNVIIRHPCTQDWLDAVNGGGTAGDDPWDEGLIPLYYNRTIEAIDGNQITIDAPVFNHLDRSLAQSFVYPVTRENLLREAGLEDIRFTVEVSGDRRESRSAVHTLVQLRNTEDCWVRGCTARNFSYAGFSTSTTTRATITDCKALDPFAPVQGGERYNFAAGSNSQLVLFENCVARAGRHNFVTNGNSGISGVVFKDVTVHEAASTSEPHRRWDQGILFDNFESVSNLSGHQGALALTNRGSFGTSHGWAGSHCVAWNCTVHQESNGVVVEQPPTAQNYAIGCSGPTDDGPFDKPRGHYRATVDLVWIRPRCTMPRKRNDSTTVAMVAGSIMTGGTAAGANGNIRPGFCAREI